MNQNCKVICRDRSLRICYEYTVIISQIVFDDMPFTDIPQLFKYMDIMSHHVELGILSE